MKKENFVLISVLQLSNASLIPGISKWKKEFIFSGVVHPAKKPVSVDRRRHYTKPELHWNSETTKMF